MYIEFVDSYEELSVRAQNYILKAIEEKNNLLLCAATGNSPKRAYQLLAGDFQKNSSLFSALRVLKLDEWGGIPVNQPGTCEAYLQENLIQPLRIPKSRYISFNSNPEDPNEECNSVKDKLKKEGPIDLCILGLGRNGHLALNEPADFLQPHCHVAELSELSLQHQMTTEMDKKPFYGLTLGMADIMNSRQILILVTGAEKEAIVKQFLSKKITTAIPASFLWLHPNVICLIESETVENIC